MSYLDIAKDWFATLNPNSKGSNSKALQYYYKFRVAWMTLIAIAKNLNDSRERRALNTLKKEIPESFAKGFINYKKEKISELDSFYILNDSVSYPDSFTLSQIQELKEREAKEFREALGTTDYKRILGALIEVLYIIRCNFFHVHKTYTNDRDNDIIFVSSHLLVELVENLLKQEFN